MSQGLERLDPCVRDALDELRGIIRLHHPAAGFEVSRAEDEPENVHLTVTVDLEDADEVIDRVVELQVEDRVPVHVIPVRTPERILAEAQSRLGHRRSRPRRDVPSLQRLLKPSPAP